jgi:hypothetical protein
MAMGIKKVEGDIDNIYSTAWYLEQAAIAKRQNREHIAKYDRSFNGIMAKADADDGDLRDDDRDDRDDVVAESDNKVSQLADLLIEAGTFASRAEALSWLLRHPNGHQLVRAHKAGKELPMGKTETLRAIAKAGGIIAVAKAITDENRNYGITEHEFVALATEHAKAAHPELTEAAAFAKMYEIPEIWRACAVLKSMPLVANVEPLVVGGADTRDLSDQSEAIAQLKELGARKWPSASEAQQFANAFSDPAHAKLASRAHRRPSAPAGGIYPYPNPR